MTTGRWLTAIVALGAILRFVPIWFGLPYAQARPDETVALGLANSVRAGDLNPHFFHWPSLTIYAFAALEAAASAIRRAFTVDSGSTFVDQVVIARAFIATAGTLTLVVLFGIARRMADTTTGLLATFFLAVSILHVRESHFAMTDVLMTFLLTTSLALLLRAIDTNPEPDSRSGAIRWFAAAGLVGGLAASTKYSAAAVLAALGAAQLYSIAKSRAPFLKPTTWLPAATFGATFLLGFIAATPYALLDFPAFEADLRFDVTHLAGGHGIDLGRGWQYHLTNSLPYRSWCAGIRRWDCGDLAHGEVLSPAGDRPGSFRCRFLWTDWQRADGVFSLRPPAASDSVPFSGGRCRTCGPVARVAHVDHPLGSRGGRRSGGWRGGTREQCLVRPGPIENRFPCVGVTVAGAAAPAGGLAVRLWRRVPRGSICLQSSFICGGTIHTRNHLGTLRDGRPIG